MQVKHAFFLVCSNRIHLDTIGDNEMRVKATDHRRVHSHVEGM